MTDYPTCTQCGGDILPDARHKPIQCLACQARWQELITELEPYLYHGGDKRHVLTDPQHVALFALGDGYGRMTAAQLRAEGLEWDWSHVRDSSLEALEAMVEALRRLLVAA